VLLQDFSPGAALITDQGAILHVSGRTSPVLALAHGPFENDIFTMARSDLRLELRSAVHKAARSGEAITIERIPLGGEGPPSSVRLTVRPLPTPAGDPRLLMVVFDVRAEPEARRAPGGDGGAGAATYVEDLEAELRRTKEDLQSTIEELETSNEELKSSNEELLSMNEELQSANEELQTSKEELQSVNEELQTVNAELQKKVEEVNRSHDDLENLFQSTRIATMFLDHDLRVKRFTPATAEIFRLIESDLGRPITDISAPFEDRAWIADVHEVLRNLAPKERLLYGPDGGSWHMLRVLPYRTRANVIEGAVATFIDVTELKRLEARARHLAAIVDSSSDAILGSTLDGIITSWNRGAELLFGYSTEEAIGLSRSFLIAPDRLGEIEEVKRRLTTGEGGDPVETVRLRKDGSAVSVSLRISPVLDEAGKLAGYSVIARDITARKAAEAENARLTRELERAVEQLRTLLEVAPIGLAVAADPDCRVIQGNKAAAAMFEVAPDVNISKSAEGAEELPFRVLRADKEEEVASADLAMQRAASTGTAVIGEEYDIVFRGGRRRSIVVSAVPLRGERGEPGGAVAAFIDVTEERQRQSELQSASRNKDEFLALLGHELRNPLGAIAMAVKLLERKWGDGENRSLDIVSRQVRHLTRLVDDILDVARVSHGKIRLEAEPVELGALLAQVVDDHREPARTRDVELELRRDGHDVWVRGDRVRLVQVFGNLLSNALKFTSARGRVTLNLRADGGMAIVDVADTGIGMEPALVARLFQPFEQGSWGLDRSQGGLGLGLALARRLVDLQGGALVADSAGAGHGSSLTVRLPIATAPEQPSDPSPAPRAGPARILVIEDNRDGAETLAEVLRLEGHEVEVAHDGASGIEAARGSPPDLIICDIGLPGKLDGYAVARILREDPALRSTCLVALTGYARESDIEQAREAGFAHHLAKPPSVERLRALIVSWQQRPPPRARSPRTDPCPDGL
jgi:two-component system CheB/CheR fusion protein